MIHEPVLKVAGVLQRERELLRELNYNTYLPTVPLVFDCMCAIEPEILHRTFADFADVSASAMDTLIAEVQFARFRIVDAAIAVAAFAVYHAAESGTQGVEKNRFTSWLRRVAQRSNTAIEFTGGARACARELFEAHGLRTKRQKTMAGAEFIYFVFHELAYQPDTQTPPMPVQRARGSPSTACKRPRASYARKRASSV